MSPAPFQRKGDGTKRLSEVRLKNKRNVKYNKNNNETTSEMFAALMAKLIHYQLTTNITVLMYNDFTWYKSHFTVLLKSTQK